MIWHLSTSPRRPLRPTVQPETSPFRWAKSTALHRLRTYGRRDFATAGPSAWNSLPDPVRNPNFTEAASRHLMLTTLTTFLFARYERTTPSLFEVLWWYVTQLTLHFDSDFMSFSVKHVVHSHTAPSHACQNFDMLYQPYWKMAKRRWWTLRVERVEKRSKSAPTSCKYRLFLPARHYSVHLQDDEECAKRRILTFGTCRLHYAPLLGSAYEKYIYIRNSDENWHVSYSYVQLLRTFSLLG